VELLGDIWNTVIIMPMINSLVLLYSVFFDSFGLSILIFTLVIRGLMVPLTVKQSRQMKAMSALQPKLKELQERYGKDKQRISQETMKTYRENGVNPLGCLGPMFVQFPIWIGLYRSLLQTLPSTPESLVELSAHLYSWLPQVHEAIPLDSSFLWLDLALPDPSPLVLPILVGGSMFFMQKMTTMPSIDSKQASTNRMMLWMMPLMFGFFTLQFPSGLALYWVASNVVGIVIQGFVTGWGPLATVFSFRRPENPAEAPALAPSAEEIVTDADDRNDSEDRGRSSRNRPKGARRRPRRSRNRRH
jgi:YidC/Oxa1 family membrane protein insertase